MLCVAFYDLTAWVDCWSSVRSSCVVVDFFFWGGGWLVGWCYHVAF